MRLRRLVAQDFRNLAPLDLDLDADFVVLHGPNAQGKTNALEAIWVLASLRPLRASRPGELIRWGAEGMQIAGWVASDEILRHHRVDLRASKREVQLDGQRCAQLDAYFRDLRAICFTPTDAQIVEGGPEERRRWVDRAAFTARPAHLDLVRGHQRALLHKGATLRMDRPERELLDAIDDQLATLGAELVARRSALVSELAPHVARMVAAFGGADGPVSLTLRTQAAGASVGERRASLAAAYARARPAELRRRRTLVGPQTDDVEIQLGEQPARRFASRGQVRSLVLALKLAELHASRARGVVPLFLLDDLSSELDRGRTHQLIGMLGDLGAQVFATTTDPGPLDVLPASSTRRFRVRDGVIQPDS